MIQLSDHLVVETDFLWANVGAAITEAGVGLLDFPVRPTDSQKPIIVPRAPLGNRCSTHGSSRRAKTGTPTGIPRDCNSRRPPGTNAPLP